MISKLEDPEELESSYFKIQSTLEPNNLVEASKIILQAVNAEPMLTYSYCLEVLFEDDKAFFTLCLNPVLWFDVYLRKKDLNISAKIAKSYITNTRLTVSYENYYKTAPFEVEYSETVNSSAFALCEYERKYCDNLDSICKSNSTTRDVLDDLVAWERENYYIMYRHEPIRGLQFVSCPNDDEETSFNHFDNTTMWETKQARSDDKYMQDRHDHVHFNFDDAGWESFKNMVFGKPNLKSLTVRCMRSANDIVYRSLLSMLDARNFPEPNNRLKNCFELERFWLQIVEPQLMVENSTKLIEKLDNVITALSETKDNVNTKLDNVVTTLSETMDNVNAKLDIVNAKLDNVVTALSETNSKLS
ncbi:12255_t:CDS:2 [Dentiscutata erythropus]|uniref:12255_t:CDS:1 n=1 Tax=Dentiscutata erythropus TaxID=1348616 RepID=A0A9N9IJF4_9GLOM|nr:12255_t:CDS:2 [Dentiscutata erythropus]